MEFESPRNKIQYFQDLDNNYFNFSSFFTEVKNNLLIIYSDKIIPKYSQLTHPCKGQNTNTYP